MHAYLAPCRRKRSNCCIPVDRNIREHTATHLHWLRPRISLMHCATLMSDYSLLTPYEPWTETVVDSVVSLPTSTSFEGVAYMNILPVTDRFTKEVSPPAGAINKRIEHRPTVHQILFYPLRTANCSHLQLRVPVCIGLLEASNESIESISDSPSDTTRKRRISRNIPSKTQEQYLRAFVYYARDE
jgi:hypothetical protein